MADPKRPPQAAADANEVLSAAHISTVCEHGAISVRLHGADRAVFAVAVMDRLQAQTLAIALAKAAISKPQAAPADLIGVPLGRA